MTRSLVMYARSDPTVTAVPSAMPSMSRRWRHDGDGNASHGTASLSEPPVPTGHRVVKGAEASAGSAPDLFEPPSRKSMGLLRLKNCFGVGAAHAEMIDELATIAGAVEQAWRKVLASGPEPRPGVIRDAPP